ncbi:MAG: hypothetical protein KIH44_003300 [Octadecabacter sp.]|nr:hypothetical protein [Octadecabacter sp.]
MTPLCAVAAARGFAGWGVTILGGFTVGKLAAILPHIIITIALMGLSVWAAFWGLIALNSKSPNNSST